MPLEIWATVEGATLIIAASLPTIGPFVRYAAHGFKVVPPTYGSARPTDNTSPGVSAQKNGKSSRVKMAVSNMLSGDGTRGLSSESADDDVYLVGMSGRDTKPGTNGI